MPPAAQTAGKSLGLQIHSFHSHLPVPVRRTSLGRIRPPQLAASHLKTYARMMESPLGLAGFFAPERTRPCRVGALAGVARYKASSPASERLCGRPPCADGRHRVGIPGAVPSVAGLSLGGAIRDGEALLGNMLGKTDRNMRIPAQKSRARLASPQSRPTSPVYGAGGNNRLLKRLLSTGVVPAAAGFFWIFLGSFYTRLSDRSNRELGWLRWRCSADRHGARDQRPCHRFAIVFLAPARWR